MTCPGSHSQQAAKSELNLALEDYFGHIRLPSEVKSRSHIKKKLIQDSSKWATFTLAHTREHSKALAGTPIIERSRETGKVP